MTSEIIFKTRVFLVFVAIADVQDVMVYGLVADSESNVEEAHDEDKDNTTITLTYFPLVQKTVTKVSLFKNKTV